MQSYIKILKKLRNQYIKYYGLTPPTLPKKEIDANVISEKIRAILLSSKPCMLARFGSVEIGCITNYLGIYHQKKNFQTICNYIRGKAFPMWWEEETFHSMMYNAGFFSANPSSLKKFSQMMLKDMTQVDILASWRQEESFFKDELNKAYRIDFESYNPFWSEIPWSIALEGKKVLVIHPFAKSIEQQYQRRQFIHKDERILPSFHLETIKAIQSIGGQCDASFNDWFTALEFMKNEIDKRDYDICLIGCGAYGFPLAAHVKRSHKKAIHMGGSLQLLFGIKGKRWEDENYNEYYNYKNLMNQFWVKPLVEETPTVANQIEAGCYW